MVICSMEILKSVPV